MIKEFDLASIDKDGRLGIFVNVNEVVIDFEGGIINILEGDGKEWNGNVSDFKGIFVGSCTEENTI